MNLILKRIYLHEAYTIGALQIDGKYYCDTLEPTVRDLTTQKKIPGKTAIPPGRYRIQLKHSTKFHRSMPYLLDVPHFTGIMIHTGNSAGYLGKKSDTRGCILVGKNTIIGQLTCSRIYFQELHHLISQAIDQGQEVWITVQ